MWKNPDNVIRVLPHIDYMFLDEAELRFIANRQKFEKSVSCLQSKGLDNIVVTQGNQGSVVFLKNNCYQIPAFPVNKLVDPTGAGDSYAAGFVHAMSLFNDPIKQGKFAAMTATMGIENKGPFNKTADEVLKRLKLE